RTLHPVLADRAPSGERVFAAHGRDLFVASLCRGPALDTGSVSDLCHGDRVQPSLWRGRARAHSVHPSPVRAAAEPAATDPRTRPSEQAPRCRFGARILRTTL